MSESKVFKQRKCKKCGEEIHANAQGLKNHAAKCKKETKKGRGNERGEKGKT